MSTATKPEQQTSTITSGQEPAHLVCQGALCRCDKAVTPASMLVTSHRKYYVNDTTGSQKLIATDQDNQVTSLHFGSCLATGKPQPCTAQLQWQTDDRNRRIQLGNGACPLLSDNTACCTLWGGQVTILRHGQTPSMAAESITATAENQDMDDPVAQPALKPVIITAISCCEKPGAAIIHIRPCGELTFAVTTYGGSNTMPTTAEQQQVCWDIKKEDTLPYSFGNHGPELGYTFEAGSYSITAYSRDSPTVSNTLQVVAGPNSMCSIDGPSTIHGKTPQQFTAVFTLPPLPEETALLHWFLSDENGHLLKELHGKDTMDHIFEQSGHYTLRVYSDEDATTLISNEITVITGAQVVLSSSHTQIRPGDTATIHLSADTPAFVSWEQTDDSGTTRPVTAAQDQTSIQRTFSRPGKYTITAHTTDADNHTAQVTITVCDNAVKAVSRPRKMYTGFPVTFTVSELVFPELSIAEIHKLRWVMEGPENTSAFGNKYFTHTFEKEGAYILYAYLYNKNTEGKISFHISTPSIVLGRWMDSDGNVRRQAGYGQQICAYFEHTGLQGEIVVLEVYAQHTTGNRMVYCRHLRLPDTTRVYHNIQLDDRFKQPAASSWQQQVYLYFLIKTAIVPAVRNSHQPLPAKTTDYLLLTNSSRIQQAYFTDPSDHREYFITNRKTPVALKIYAINLTGKELAITIMLAQHPHQLNRPLTVYSSAEISFITKGDKPIETGKYTVDTNGEILLQPDFRKLPARDTGVPVYAIIRLPGFNAVYTRTLLVYREDSIRLTHALQGRATVAVERIEMKQQRETCKSLVWGSRVSCAFRLKVMDISKKLHADPNHLMTCMAFETGGSFLPYHLSGYNRKNTPLPEEITDAQLDSRAVGLVQFTIIAIKDIKKTTGIAITKRELSKMSAMEQLDYVYYYLQNFTGKLNTLADFYMAILKPSMVKKNEQDTVFSKYSNNVTEKKWYAKNSGLDADRNLIITKKEVGTILHTKYAEGLNYKNTCDHKCAANIPGNKPAQQQWHHPTDNIQLRGWYAEWDPARSKYGLINERKSGKHQGVDFYAPSGANVYACVTGILSATYYSNTYGNVIIIYGIYQETSYYFMYAHLLEKAAIPIGSTVTMGSIIGHTGKSGNASTLSPKQEHLHFEIRTRPKVERGFDGRIDPFSVIAELNSNTILNPQQHNQK